MQRPRSRGHAGIFAKARVSWQAGIKPKRQGGSYSANNAIDGFGTEILTEGNEDNKVFLNSSSSLFPSLTSIRKDLQIQSGSRAADFVLEKSDQQPEALVYRSFFEHFLSAKRIVDKS